MIQKEEKDLTKKKGKKKKKSRGKKNAGKQEVRGRETSRKKAKENQLSKKKKSFQIRKSAETNGVSIYSVFDEVEYYLAKRGLPPPTISFVGGCAKEGEGHFSTCCARCTLS
ncbi:hypothetical protein CDAR_617571 [Caerostris darwini]|uniref:Uncharacterized protein n=1 Tax=Caerostris darwini TaxID=1538125 RepID=A0AAV4VSC8_9ARAC|nr:hypothetical protein CDAR_617571 [Caerostris darwini]